jgi:hypothetical protein
VINLNEINSIEEIEKLKQRIRELEENYDPSKRISFTFKGKDLLIKKAYNTPNFIKKSILTENCWRFVDIHLKLGGHEKARKYWEQACEFYFASKQLKEISSPLTTYYCFLNAVKAFLLSKNKHFEQAHGVRGDSSEEGRTIESEKIIICRNGILPSYCEYLGETIGDQEYTFSLKDALYNIPYIHRAFCLSYKGTSELFIPIINPRFIYNRKEKRVWFEAELEMKYSNQRTLEKIDDFEIDNFYKRKNYLLKSKRNLDNINTSSLTNKNNSKFEEFYRDIRKCLEYIHGPRDLWYIKRCNVKKAIDRTSMTLTFAAMHKLSELARYNPDRLEKYLSKNSHWLLSEFINNSRDQFIDQISSEITGCDIRLPGIKY